MQTTWVGNDLILDWNQSIDGCWQRTTFPLKLEPQREVRKS